MVKYFKFTLLLRHKQTIDWERTTTGKQIFGFRCCAKHSFAVGTVSIIVSPGFFSVF